MELRAGPGRCEEASTLSSESYIPCNAPAEYLVDYPLRPSEGPYRMCEMCMSHNVRNRNGHVMRVLTAEEKLHVVAGPPRTQPEKKGRGKYGAVIGSLPVLLNVDVDYQQKIDAVKELLMKDPDFKQQASALAQDYDTLRLLKDQQEAELDKTNLHIIATEQLLAAQYEAEGITSQNLDTGFSIGVQAEPYTQVENREEFRLWCVANGLEKSLMLAWQTTNALAKERLLEGEPLPDGCKVWVKNKIVRRKIA